MNWSLSKSARNEIAISRRVLIGGLIGSSAAGLLLSVSPANAQGRSASVPLAVASRTIRFSGRVRRVRALD